MLMENMLHQPRKGDICYITYTGYDNSSDEDFIPIKEGYGEFLGSKFWGGGRYQRGFKFSWGEEWIYDDHAVFECIIVQRKHLLWEKIKALLSL